jgi:hypothetical protein
MIEFLASRSIGRVGVMLVGIFCASSAMTASPAREAFCPAAMDCIQNGSLCVFVQIPKHLYSRMKASEAFGDMESQVVSLQARRKDVHYVIAERNLSSMLSGLTPTNKVQTVFVSKGGRALVSPDLYVDDPAPIELFFKTQKLPDALIDIVTMATVAIPNGACDSNRHSP